MMKIQPVNIALILSLVLPVASNIALQKPAFASLPFPEGEFFDYQNTDKTWHITLWKQQNTYYYKSLNLKNKQRLCLVGGVGSGNQKRSVFTWRNRGYKYQVAWQPVEANLIRLIVLNPANKVVFNQILKREPGEFEDPNATKCK